MAKSQRTFAGLASSTACISALGLAPCGCGSKTDLIIGGGEQDGTAAICTSAEPPLATSLVHRYSFKDIGTTVTDSKGGADGQTTSTAADGTPGIPGSGPPLDGSGQLALDGSTQYVDLPNGLVSTLGNATFVAWTELRGGPAFQRIFDFGSSTAGEGKRAECSSCVLLMNGSGNVDGKGLCAQVHTPAIDTQQIVTNQFLDKSFRQVALVFESNVRVSLYLEGVQIGQTAITTSLADIVDDNDWLGLSQYKQDMPYEGDYEEFRIYDRALTPCEVRATFDAGPERL